MVSREDKAFVLWPLYFDASASRAAGRRLPLRLAVKSPTVEEIAKAARSLKLDPKIEPKAAHPSGWAHPTGRVIVSQKANKTKVLRAVASRIKKGRQA